MASERASQQRTGFSSHQDMIAGDNVIVVTIGIILIVILTLCCLYEMCCAKPRYVRSRVVIHNDVTSIQNILPRYENPPVYELHCLHEPSCPPPNYIEPSYPARVVLSDSFTQRCSPR